MRRDSIKILIVLSMLSASLQAQQKEAEWNFNKSIPRWVRAEIGARHLQQKYNLTYQLYPPQLKGDFNGDGRNDVALLVQEKQSGKFGIAIFHARRPQAIFTSIIILGAGNILGGVGDDFRWANFWKLVREDAADSKGPQLKGDAIQLEHRRSRSGLIHWNGKSYEWFQRKK